MRDRTRRAEAWLNGLRTWQFVLIWNGAAVAFALLGAFLGQLLSAGPFDPSAFAGSVIGASIAATIFTFVARSRMRDRAKKGAGGPGDRAQP